MLYVMLTFWLRRSGALGQGGVGPPGATPPQGYGFSAVLVTNRVSILANFGHFGSLIGYGLCTLALIWVCS